MLKGESEKSRKRYNATQGYRVYPVFYTLNQKPENHYHTRINVQT